MLQQNQDNHESPDGFNGKGKGSRSSQVGAVLFTPSCTHFGNIYHAGTDLIMQQFAMVRINFVSLTVSYRELIEKAQKNWSTPDFEKPTKVVICGGTGHGKSTLINALVGDEVLPAGEEGGACTSAVIEVKSNTEDEMFKATVQFLDQSQWEQVLCKWIQFEGLHIYDNIRYYVRMMRIYVMSYYSSLALFGIPLRMLIHSAGNLQLDFSCVRQNAELNRNSCTKGAESR